KQNPWPEKWLESVANAYHVSEQTPETELFWLSLLKNELKDQFVSFAKMTQLGIDIANDVDGPYHYTEALEADLAIIEKVLDHIDDWEQLREIIQKSSLKRLSGKRVECDEAKKDKIKDIRDTFRKQLITLKERWFSRSLPNHLRDMETLFPIVQELTKLVLQFEERFIAEKRKRVIVDFNDLEHFSLQILTESDPNEAEAIPSQIAHYYQNQFKEILVDEYQDINLVQETIIQSISKQSGYGNVFMVGDVKQSIYRFRHAEPTLFIEKYEQYKANKQAGQRIDLAKNFRSRETILTGANFIFKQIFDQSLGDISYDEAAELVYGNKGYDEHPLTADEAELIIINDENNVDEVKSTGTDSMVEELTKIQLEARMYANKIKTWLGHNGEEPLQVLDKKTG